MQSLHTREGVHAILKSAELRRVVSATALKEPEEKLAMATESHTGVLRDRCGLEVHCSSQEAMDRYNQGLIEYVRSYGDSMASFGKALELDNGFFLINCTLVSTTRSVCSRKFRCMVG